jgi:hypothetical protein
VHVEVGGDLVVDLGQELLELGRTVASVQAEITVPSAVLNAANRLVVPCRT